MLLNSLPTSRCGGGGGTTRENLSRSLALLTEHGVRIRGREIVIDKREQLEAFARPQRFIDDPSS
jgi:CRP/FNR family transcriptional activator FtrB